MSPTPDENSSGSAGQAADGHNLELPVPATISDLGDIPLQIPFGRYTLVREIRQGGMGAVYEADQENPTRRVAIKIMRTPRASAAAKARFLREIRILARFDHPCIAQLLDAGVHRQGVIEAPYYAMELVRGASSITAHADAKSLDVSTRLRLFLNVCSAVQHSHQHGVLHCDLKPSNILVNAEDFVKVIDFGVARLLAPDDNCEPLLSDASLLLGTPQYMSPEQVLGTDGCLDVRSDVYALGLVLYELLCRCPAYQVNRSSVLAAASSIRDAQLVLPSKIDPALRGDIERVLVKALQKLRSDRYQTVAALAEDLERLLKGEPVLAPPVRRGQHVIRAIARAAARHRLFAIVAAMIVTSVACQLAGIWIADRGLNKAFERFLTTRVHHFQSKPLAKVVVLAIHDHIDPAALGDATPAERQTIADSPQYMRRVHGRFLNKLADAGVEPRVIALDLFFPSPSPFDVDLVEGIRRLGKIPVVTGAARWDFGAHDQLGAPPTIAQHAECGGITGDFNQDQAWAIDLALGRAGGIVRPSLALLAAAKYWNPPANCTVDLSYNFLELTDTGLAASQSISKAPPQVVDFSSLETETADLPQFGIAANDLVADYLLELPGADALAASTIDYTKAFQASPEELRNWLHGKVVLIGDCRSGRDGPYSYPDGRKLSGCYAHAVAIEHLIEGTPLLRPRHYSLGRAVIHGALVETIAATILGAILGVVLHRRNAARFGVLCLAIAGLTILSLVLYAAAGRVHLPLVPVLAVLTTAELTAAVWRARERLV